MRVRFPPAALGFWQSKRMADRRTQESTNRALWLLVGVIIAAMFSACVVLLFCQAFVAPPPK